MEALHVDILGKFNFLNYMLTPASHRAALRAALDERDRAAVDRSTTHKPHP